MLYGECMCVRGVCVCVCVCVGLRGIQVLLRELGHSPSRAAAGPESGLGLRLFYSLTLTSAATSTYT